MDKPLVSPKTATLYSGDRIDALQTEARGTPRWNDQTCGTTTV